MSEHAPTVVFLSHADSDLSMLMSAMRELPADFPRVGGYGLQAVTDETEMAALCSKISSSRVVILRCLGEPRKIPGIDSLLDHLRTNGQHLLAVSGTGEPSPELLSLSTVAPQVVLDATAYLQSGGACNVAQLLRYLCDHLLFTAYGYEPPAVLPDHGIYHPLLTSGNTLEHWKQIRRHGQAVGIVFYRAHWISGNLDFIDALVQALDKAELDALPVFTSSLRALQPQQKIPAAFEYFLDQSGRSRIQLLINTTSFAMGEITPGATTLAGWSIEALEKLDVPVLQAVTSGMSQEQWLASVRGLTPLDTAMNVVLPEFDGRIMTVPITFKERLRTDDIEVTRYLPADDRIQRLVGIVSKLAVLRQKPNKEKKVAFVFTNSSSKASQIGNAVGLDSPASMLSIIDAMKKRGYSIAGVPKEADKLIHDLIDRCSYDQSQLSAEQCAQALGRIPLSQYQKWHDELPAELKQKIVQQWGAPKNDIYCHEGTFIIAGLSFGNIVIILQPPRGYGMDPNAIYHQPDLPPTHHYYATYKWLRDCWGADALVHVGKHGTLEWLPGKAVGLSHTCFPDVLLCDLPLFYPFILNDPGEGSQAKRRTHATIIDHLMPPMTSADTYGPLAELVQTVDEYYQAEVMDPGKVPLLQRQIWKLVQKANLQYDLATFITQELEEHAQLAEQPHQPDTPAPQQHLSGGINQHLGTNQISGAQGDAPAYDLHSEQLPEPLANMDWLAFSHLIQEIDGYLCELGAAQIRNGLHILGDSPSGEALIDTLRSLTRLPNVGAPGLQSELAKLFDIDLHSLLQQPGARLPEKVSALNALEAIVHRDLFSNADVIEALDTLAADLYRALLNSAFQSSSLDRIIADVFPLAAELAQERFSAVRQVLAYVCETLEPKLRQSTDEIVNLLSGLEGRYVPAGPSGAPTRGMAHILPTGRNFYAIDPNTLPSQSAWEVGQQLAEEIVRRYRQETGRYPETVSISAWGTSAMRTHGDDIAEVLALIGVRPVWQPENRRVIDVEVIPASVLGRPRIDVTTRISGFFRDAFPAAIELLDRAVARIIALDEPPDINYIRKHYLQELQEHIDAGTPRERADRLARFRIFGSKPGTYGAGILPLIQERNWSSHADFAQAYINWGGYAYGEAEYGVDARAELRRRLGSTEVAIHNQDNREHDIFDSDDYLQFHGGMIATIRHLSGRSPKKYFGDSQNPTLAKVRDLKQEVLRVFRSRVVNPKWIDSIKKHGYKGALELAATVDYMFGYDATAEVMEDWMYEEVTQRYLLDSELRAFLEESNPWALNAMSERLLEAVSRQMWKSPSESTLAALRQSYLDSETLLEARSGNVPVGAKQ